jgi:hypothetical protein
MNAVNALMFAVLGMVSEILPLAMPSLFPRTLGDQSSTRALWLEFMGATLFVVGAAYLVRMQVVPAFVRLVSAAPAAGPGAVALPAAREGAGRLV